MTVAEIETYACDVLKEKLRETESLLLLYQDKQATHARYLCWGVYTEYHQPECLKAEQKVKEFLEKRESLKLAIHALELKYNT